MRRRMVGSTRPRRLAVGLAAVAVLAVGAGACSSSRDSSAKFSSVSQAIGGESDGAAPVAAGSAPSPGGANKAAGDVGGGAGGATGASFNTDVVDAPPAETGRSFISTATMTVKADDVPVAKAKAVALTEAAGGGLFGEQTTFAERANAVLTLKVPPAKFRPLLDDLAALGALRSQEVKTDDVTAQVVDLDARINASAASLARTQALLEKATSLTDIANLEQEVARRQADLESLRGQQKTLADRIDLATVVLTLTSDTPTPAIAEAKAAPPPAEPPTFGDGLARGTAAVSTIGTWLAALAGVLLPFLPIVLVVGAVVAVSRRRRGEPGPIPTGPASPASPAG